MAGKKKVSSKPKVVKPTVEEIVKKAVEDGLKDVLDELGRLRRQVEEQGRKTTYPDSLPNSRDENNPYRWPGYPRHPYRPYEPRWISNRPVLS